MNWKVGSIHASNGIHGGAGFTIRYGDRGGCLKAQGFLFGCSQNGVAGFGDLFWVPTEKEVDELIAFLMTLDVNGVPGGNNWKPRRWLFTLSAFQCAPWHNYLASKAKLLDTYKNLAHPGTVRLYMLSGG